MASVFSDRRIQNVVIEGHISVLALVISAVPHGTVLGPLLFLLFVNDLESSVKHSKIKLFADDSHLIKSLNPDACEYDQSLLQEDLDAVLDWAIKNNMLLNQKKFQLLSAFPRP